MWPAQALPSMQILKQPRREICRLIAEGAKSPIPQGRAKTEVMLAFCCVQAMVQPVQPGCDQPRAQALLPAFRPA